MNKNVFVILLVLFIVSGCAEFKQAGRDIGDTTKKVTRDIGHGTRDAVKSVGESIKEAVE